MPVNQVRRPRFYEGQYLGAEDLTTAIDYSRLENARHFLGGHTWGIAAGLELKEQPAPVGGGEVDVFIQPGYAWDGFGRPLVVISPFKLGKERFSSFTYDATKPNGYPIDVWLRYQEAGTQGARFGFASCEAADQNSRIEESFQVEVGPRPGHSDRHDQISVAGRSMDAQQVQTAFDSNVPPKAPELFDESVPYQAFPDASDRSRWLVFLGRVLWKPNPANQTGGFAALTGSDLTASLNDRRYVGVVAGSIEAPGGQLAENVVVSGHIRLHDRTKDYSLVQSKDLVWVEGSLRVEGDARLFGSKLDFRDAQGTDKGIPLKFQRDDVAAGGSSSIQAVIGSASAGNNSFAVGPLDNTGAFQSKMIVRDDGRVGIGTKTPAVALHVDGPNDQSLDISTTSAGRRSYTKLMAVASNNRDESQLQFRSLFNLVAPLGAEGGRALMTVTEIGNIGIGTESPVAPLHISGDLALSQRANAAPRPLPAGGTLCWNDGTWLRLNQNLDFTKPIFGVHTPGVFSSSSLNVGGAGSWGDPGGGNVWITGNVGIGTTTPAMTLDVQGDLGRDNGPLTLHMWGARLGDVGGGILFFRAAVNGVVAMDGAGNRVGMGTSAPISKLHVVSSGLPANAGDIRAHVAVIENTDATGDADVLALKVGRNPAEDGNNFITFFASNTAIGSIEGDGGGGISFNSGSADFAEYMPRLKPEERIEKGEIVGVFAGKITKLTTNAQQLSVITGRPIMVGNTPKKEVVHLYDPVTLVGQVPVSVRGQVREGDYIIPSGLHDGVGIGVSPAELTDEQCLQIVGQAWESNSEAGAKPVITLVSLAASAANAALISILNRQRAEADQLRAEIETLTESKSTAQKTKDTAKIVEGQTS